MWCSVSVILWKLCLLSTIIFLVGEITCYQEITAEKYMVCHIQIVGGGKFLARNLGMFPFKTVEIQFPFFFFFPERRKETLAS